MNVLLIAAGLTVTFAAALAGTRAGLRRGRAQLEQGRRTRIEVDRTTIRTPGALPPGADLSTAYARASEYGLTVTEAATADALDRATARLRRALHPPPFERDRP